MIRLFVSFLAALLLAGCGAEPVWAPDEAVQAARFRAPGPPSITLVTVINERSGEGGHTALLINASERVIFDPAGTWTSRYAPERNDVHFGIRSDVLAFYLDYHVREQWYAVIQEREVPPEVAELALERVKAYGAVPKAFCANSTSEILRGLPGFETLPRTFFPKKLMKAFATLPGVRTREIHEGDFDGDRARLLALVAAVPQG